MSVFLEKGTREESVYVDAHYGDLKCFWATPVLGGQGDNNFWAMRQGRICVSVLT